jgi:putative membrane protein
LRTCPFLLPAYVPILWASVLALATPWPLIEFTQWSVQRIFALQLVVFILMGFPFSWMPLRLALVSRPIPRLRAHRAALEQFVIRRVTHTRNRCGILIFISMAEHYARVIADEGIAQNVHQAEWQSTVDILIEHTRNGQIAAGFVAAIERCGAVLAAHGPPDGSANDLPDRLYVI